MYYTFLEKWTIATRFSTGATKSISGTSILFDDRFLLGGVGSVRGYREGIISDLTPVINRQYFFDGSIELRRQLFWQLIGLVFYDIGSITSQDALVKGTYSSVGGGLRFSFGVGSLSFEYGYVYDKNKRLPADRMGRLHLAIGAF